MRYRPQESASNVVEFFSISVCSVELHSKHNILPATLTKML